MRRKHHGSRSGISGTQRSFPVYMQPVQHQTIHAGPTEHPQAQCSLPQVRLTRTLYFKSQRSHASAPKRQDHHGSGIGKGNNRGSARYLFMGIGLRCSSTGCKSASSPAGDQIQMQLESTASRWQPLCHQKYHGRPDRLYQQDREDSRLTCGTVGTGIAVLSTN